MTRLLSLLCRLPKKWGGGHKFGRPYLVDPIGTDFHGEPFSGEKEKRCRRCGTVAPVKRRKREGAA